MAITCKFKESLLSSISSKMLPLLFCFVIIFESVNSALIDWSTLQLTQEWFDELASGFTRAGDGNDNYEWKDAIQTFDENVFDCNAFGCTSTLNDLQKILEQPTFTKFISSINAHFDVLSWANDQVMVRNTYIFRNSIDDEVLVSTSFVTVRLTKDKQKISVWIYTMDEATKKRTASYFGKMSKLTDKSDL
eukprot:308790_1